MIVISTVSGPSDRSDSFYERTSNEHFLSSWFLHVLTFLYLSAYNYVDLNSCGQLLQKLFSSERALDPIVTLLVMVYKLLSPNKNLQLPQHQRLKNYD